MKRRSNPTLGHFGLLLFILFLIELVLFFMAVIFGRLLGFKIALIATFWLGVIVAACFALIVSVNILVILINETIKFIKNKRTKGAARKFTSFVLTLSFLLLASTGCGYKQPSKRDPCKSGSYSDSVLYEKHWDDTSAKRELFGDCNGSVEVEMWTIEGGGHTWPCGKQYANEFFIGKPIREIDGNKKYGIF